MTHTPFKSGPGPVISASFGALRRVRPMLLVAGLSTTAALAAPPPWMGAFSAGGNGYTLARSIKAAPGNDFYVTGEFSSSAKFSGTTVVSRGGSDVFLARYTESGKLLWIVTAGGTDDDVGWGVDVDGDGNAYLTGWFANSGTFDSADKSSKTVSGVGNTIFLAKYSPAGKLAWVETGTVTYNGVFNFGYGVAVDSAAHTAYLAALSQGDTTFSSANGSTDTVPGVGTWHVVLAKYGTDGNFDWAQTNQGNPNSVPNGVAVDSNGNAYVTGWLEDQTTFSSADGKDITVTGFSPAQTTSDYPDDAFLAKYDQNGNAVWVNHIGGYKAIANGVAVSPKGDVTLVGYIGNIDNGAEADTIVSSQPPRKNYILHDYFLTDPYNPDVLIVTYSAAGVFQFARRIGHAGSEDAKAVTYDTNGDLYVVGISRLYVVGIPGQTPTDRPNLFIRKYHGSNLEWQQKAGSSALWIGEGTAPAVSVGNSGNIYVAGGFQHWARFGTTVLTGAGSANMFVAELAPTAANL